MFKKILVANRGEIAIRIIRTCKEMGIKTVALCPKKGQEKNFWETELADEIGYLEEEGVYGYLNQRKILKIAKFFQAEAVHPGYGFLSENADFAKLCEENQIKFIGPRWQILKLLGDKIEAKKIAKKCGLPVLPSVEREVRTEKELKNVIKELKLPVVLKAVDGGGGMGIEIITKENFHAIKEIFEKLKRISQSAFASERIFIEKYLQSPRHIEFQTIGDGKNFFHLFERECSIQRRHQKLVEEAPSPLLDDKTRKNMGKLASRLIKYLGYEGLATVEFLVDQNRNFYFIEVNPRLQVEHPVTEAILGLDLVREQILIASGERISFKKDDIQIKGHAIEFRVNAEDPFDNFRPSHGKITRFQMPGGKGIEIHTFCRQGQEVFPYFDPLLLKLVVFGKTRKEALKRAKMAFEEMEIEGVKTLIPFFKEVLKNENFWEGRIDTDFIKKERIVDFLRERTKVEERMKKKEKSEGLFLEEKEIAFLLASFFQEEKKEEGKKNGWKSFWRLKNLEFD